MLKTLNKYLSNTEKKYLPFNENYIFSLWCLYNKHTNLHKSQSLGCYKNQFFIEWLLTSIQHELLPY